jgi:hypothetical protein
MEMNELKGNKNFTKDILEIFPANISEKVIPDQAKHTDSLMCSNLFDHFSK